MLDRRVHQYPDGDHGYVRIYLNYRLVSHGFVQPWGDDTIKKVRGGITLRTQWKLG